MAEALPVLYATQADCEAIFSALGILWRIDDDEDEAAAAAELQFIEDALREATDIVNQYAVNYYDVTQLKESRIVARWTAWIACTILSRRRGNPGQFTDEYDNIIRELELVATGQRFIPRLQTAANFLPVVENYTFTRDNASHPCRRPAVDPLDSSGSPNPLGTAFDGAFD